MRFFSLFKIWELKDEILTLLLALRDQKTPLAGKIFAIASLLYLISPADVITDAIPFFGILDDLLIVPLGTWLAQKQIPKDVLARAQAEAKVYRGKLNTIASIIFTAILVWIVVMVVLVYSLLRLIIEL